MSDLQPEFDEFLDRISLGAKQVDRINSAFSALREVLCAAYGVPESEVFAQGSCANGTAVKPVPEGEYDLDIVVVVPNAANLSADKALSDLAAVLNSHGRYAGKVRPKKPCIRIEYADDEIGGFHIDVVPARVDPTNQAPLQAPRKGEGWHGTAPREYTEWCKKQGDGFARTVKMLKRWRDENQDVRNAVKSIVLQVLVSKCISPTGADGPRLATTLTELQKLLSQSRTPPVVLNPVLLSENLAAKWTQESYISFRQEVATAQAKAARAVNSNDDTAAASLWVEVLGEDFPLPGATAAGLVLADTSHARRITDEGWYEAINPGASISVHARVFGEDGRRRIFRDYRGKELLQAGWKLKFEAEVNGPSSATVWWQVINTGSHARNRNGLRGTFFRARDLSNRSSADQRVNWESTEYTGSHLIEAFLVDGSAVIARSGQLLVNVKNPRHTFGR